MRHALFLGTLLLCGLASARTDEALRLFEAGRRAFEEQSLAEALELFEASVTAGMSGPAVHYNIGVAAYRLGLTDRAESAFREVARVPGWAPLANYNLALVALARGDRAAAERQFSLAAATAADDRLRALATSQAVALQEPVAPPRAWTIYASLAAGHDSNVALLDDAAPVGASGRDDEFAEATLVISGPLQGSWRFDATAVQIAHADLDSLDQSAVVVGGARRFGSDLDFPHAEAGLYASYLSLDGEGLEQAATLALQAAAPLPAGWRLRARYRLSRVDGLEAFEGLTGWRNALGTRIDTRRIDWRAGFEYRFEYNDTEAEAFAARWHQLGAELGWAPQDSTWSITFGVAQRRTWYDGEPDEDIGTGRREDRTTLAAMASVRLGMGLRALARIEHTLNDADLDGFDYDRDRILIGVEYVR